MKTASVPFKSGYYQIITNDVGDQNIGLSIACFDVDPSPVNIYKQG